MRVGSVVVCVLSDVIIPFVCFGSFVKTSYRWQADMFVDVQWN